MAAGFASFALKRAAASASAKATSSSTNLLLSKFRPSIIPPAASSSASWLLHTSATAQITRSVPRRHLSVFPDPISSHPFFRRMSTGAEEVNKNTPEKISVSLIEPPPNLYKPEGVKAEGKGNLNMSISHFGVLVFAMGVILSETYKVQFTQRLPLGSELHMGKERIALRGIDHLHGPNFHSIAGNLVIYEKRARDDEQLGGLMGYLLKFVALFDEDGRVEKFLKRRMRNGKEDDKSFVLSVFPEKRYYGDRQSTTEVAIHTNFFTDFYALIGTSSSRAGGWYTTIMKMPYIFLIWIGFMIGAIGGFRSLYRQLRMNKIRWHY